MLTQFKTTNTLHLIRCSIGDETYGLDMAWVRSIERTDRLLIRSEMHIDDTGFAGWLPSNKGDIPVFDLAGHLGRSSSSREVNAQQRIIVLPSPVPFTRGKADEGRPWALLVDQVSQVMQISEDRFQPLPWIVTNPTTNYFEGIVRLEDTLILLLSPEWLHPNAPAAHETTSQAPQEQAAQHLAQNGRAKAIDLSIPPLPQQDGPANSKGGRIMVFSTAKAEPDDRPLSFGLSITQVPEVLRPLPLIPVPAAPPFVLGLVNWRNRPVPIIDLDARLGLKRDPGLSSNGQSRLMIARGTGQNALVGFFIRPAVQTFSLPIAHRPTTRTLAVDSTLVRGMVELKNETLIIPNVPAILGEK